MNKSQLIDALSARFEGNRKAAAHALDSVLDTITREVARGEKVAITGFGSFEKRVREARVVRNPRTGASSMADRTAIARFSPGANLRSVVAGLRDLPQLALDTATAAMPGTKTTKKPAAEKSAVPLAETPGEAASTPDATATAETAPAKKAATKKAPAKKTGAKKAAAKKAPAKKTTAKKTTAKKAPAKKTTATKSAAKKAPAKKSTAKKTAAKKTTTKKTAAKKTTGQG